MTFSKECREFRNSLGFTQATFGAIIGVSAITVRHWEAGLKIPREPTLKVFRDLQARGKEWFLVIPGHAKSVETYKQDKRKKLTRQ